MTDRSNTRSFKIGSLPIGGGARVSVQTMANTDPYDFEALKSQLLSCASLGCEIFRMTVPDEHAAKVLGEIKKISPIPLVADIHFDYRAALAAIEYGADALRLNPGNIGGREKVSAVARAAKARNIPIRIGVNLGSLEKSLDARVREGDSVAECLTLSAMNHLKMLEDEGFYNVVISAKASNVKDTIETYRMLAETTDCPLHLGVTESGTALPGTVRSSVALGILLSEGIGDTVRVSLTDKPEKEVKVGLEILRSLGLRSPGPAITSCPTCGRTKVDLLHVAAAVESELERYALSSPNTVIPHVAVMGCAVNGPGEAKGADIALCGGVGEFLLFVKGEIVAKISQENAVKKVMEYVVSFQ